MKILLAIDGSPSSEAAVDEVCRRPWPAQTEVRLLIVDAPLDSPLLRTSTTVFDELVAQQRAELLNYLDAAADKIRQAAPDLIITPILREGSPKEVIVQEAEEWRADLIVVGSHGRGPLSRLFLGSVSLAVATRAPCSVEIVRTPKAASSKEAT